MSVQYTDGSFSDTMPFADAIEEFNGAIGEGTARALFVGTEKELAAIKEKASLEKQVKCLSERMEKLEEPPVESEKIIIPTRDEMINVLRNKR